MDRNWGINRCIDLEINYWMDEQKNGGSEMEMKDKRMERCTDGWTRMEVKWAGG